MNALDKQLADLRIYANELEAKLQDDIGLAPIVPPKKSKAPQPQVPQSCNVKWTCEPSYSSRLECSSRNSYAYSNLSIKTQRIRSGDVFLYSNLLPPGGTNHVYCNVLRTADVPYPDTPQPTYSELRHPGPGYPPSSASVAQDFSTYGGSQTSSTYESLYEPINPRPTSQMSARSSSSLYAPYVSGTQSAYEARAAPPPPVAPDDDQLYCGNCYNCGERILGETTGCTAMERIYHIRCFSCQQCGINLQGRPFYALKGGALCERDYLNTLEKCCVCTKPILERILRATGKPYHPHCFTCVVCRQSLDGIPFTVDAANRIHCIDDFHRRYAPRCARCKDPVVPEPGADETVRIVALDRSYHMKCYACEDCGVSLSSREEGRGCYPLDHHLYCRSCNAARIQELTRNIN